MSTVSIPFTAARLTSAYKTWVYCLGASIAAGQWLFAGYLAIYYIVPALFAGIAAWAGAALSTGYIEGDTIGNLALAAHLLPGFLIVAIGPIQLIERVRTRYRRLHRYLGRIYIPTAIISSLSGFYIVWVRGNPQAGPIENIGITIGGILTIAFAVLAYNHARKRDFVRHRIWALRLFVTASGVWAIRLGYGWLMDLDVNGPTYYIYSVAISYLQYLLPLALLEAHLRMSRNAPATWVIALTVIMFVMAAYVITGSLLAFEHLWLPRLQGQS